ncbi:MAG: ABC transporter ATP-binding protein [Alphaproteobacteria bacterium]|nr:ABC transporter ATP-binding protein [Alphaproteobacteria bacterium]
MFIAEIDRLLRRHNPAWRWAVLLAFAIAAMQSIAVVMRPLPIRALIEPPAAGSPFAWLEVATAGVIGRLWLYAGIIVLIELVVLCAMISTELVISRMSERVIRSIRGSIVASLLRGPYRALSDTGPGAVLAAASSDVEAVQRLMREAIVATGMSSLQMTLMLVVVFFVEKWLFIFLLVEILVLTAGIAIYAQWRKSRFLVKIGHEQNLLGLLATIYQRNLDLRFSGLRTLFMTRTTAFARRLYWLNRLLWMRHSHYHATMQFIIGTSAAICLVLLMLLSDDKAPPVGKFLVFAYYTMLIFPCLSQIGEAWPMMNDARAALRRITANTGETIGRAPVAPAIVEAPRPGWGRIEFDEVTVKNPRGDMILDRISFAIDPGEKIGLFGDSGSGKTTIISVLLGLQTPVGGRATIGGVDVTRLSLADRKRLFFFMRANPAFLPGSIYDNVALAQSPDDIAMQGIVHNARLEARLQQDPAGRATQVSEKGEPFSGGEQQRIAIARAFLARPPCVILDESLNSLDEAGEMAITQALLATLTDKTMIVVSHRRQVATLFANRIEFVRGGKTTVIRPAAPA